MSDTEPGANGGLAGFEVSFDATLDQRISILIAGDAGQRVQSAGRHAGASGGG